MIGRKVDNVQGSSSICKVRKYLFWKRICMWWLGFIVNVIMIGRGGGKSTGDKDGKNMWWRLCCIRVLERQGANQNGL